jgi:hypothetical protein
MTAKSYFVITAWALLLIPRLATAQGTTTIGLVLDGSDAFTQLDAYLRSGAGVTIEDPGFYNFSSAAGGWMSTFSSSTVVSGSGPPFLSYVALGFDEAGSATFSVDFYEWNGDALSDSFNISLIDGFPHTSAPASVMESAPFAVPEPSMFLALAGACAAALAVGKATK